MLPSPEQIADGFAFFARREAPLRPDEVAAIEAIVVEAGRLAAGREADEPAALLYACARRSRAFGALARDFVPFVTRRQAHLAGCRLDVDDIVLDLMRTRVLLGAMSFDQLCAEIAPRLKPHA